MDSIEQIKNILYNFKDKKHCFIITNKDDYIINITKELIDFLFKNNCFKDVIKEKISRRYHVSVDYITNRLFITEGQLPMLIDSEKYIIFRLPYICENITTDMIKKFIVDIINNTITYKKFAIIYLLYSYNYKEKLFIRILLQILSRRIPHIYIDVINIYNTTMENIIKSIKSVNEFNNILYITNFTYKMPVDQINHEYDNFKLNCFVGESIKKLYIMNFYIYYNIILL